MRAPSRKSQQRLHPPKPEGWMAPTDQRLGGQRFIDRRPAGRPESPSAHAAPPHCEEPTHGAPTRAASPVSVPGCLRRKRAVFPRLLQDIEVEDELADLLLE